MAEKTEAVSLADMIVEEVPVPESADDASSFSTGSDIACTVCGKDIAYMYKGKGRKPKYCEEHKPNSRASNLNPSGTRASADVKAAANTLDMGYSAIQMLLMMTGATQAAATLGESLPGLRAQNEQFLTQDKDLAKKINAMGKTGGRYAFFAAQILVLGPVAVLATAEYREKLGNKVVPDEDAESGDVPPTMGGFPVGH